jgi:RNA polymerase sigma-70 factor (ECF subfamily)
MDKSSRELKVRKLEAFETIVSEYETMLLRYVARIVRCHEAAQDVVQETFIKLFRNWTEELKPCPQVSSWLYRVAHNCAVDFLRKESRRRLLHIRHAEERAKFTKPNRGKEFEITEAAELAAAALQALSLREQQLVILKVYEEKSYREISDITGLTVGNVGYLLHHAMKRLAVELKNAKPADECRQNDTENTQ